MSRSASRMTLTSPGPERLAELDRWLVERNVDDVELMVADLAGIGRGKTMPRAKFIDGMSSGGLRLPESIFAMSVNGEFVLSSAMTVTEQDIFLVPDLDTLVLVPWQNEPTACAICDCRYETGKPVPLSPRQVLRNVLALYEKKGWRPVVAPEFEFYLIARQEDVHAPPKPPKGRSGKIEAGMDSYSIDGVDEFGELFDDIYDFCETQRIRIDTLIHEAGPAQFEFNVLHGEPLDVANQSFYFKRIVHQAAIRRNMFASFMAKPYPDDCGSAMHIHQSVEDIATGVNLFSDEAGKDSDLFLSHIAGLQRYLPAAMPFLAPYMNSYRRIGGGMSAPVNTHWGRENRTVGLRVPFSEPANRRVENRVAGSDVNPYLAIAASLACGWLGMVEDLRPSRPLRKSAYEKSSKTLPQHYLEALGALADSEEIAKVFGEGFIASFIEVKRREYAEYYSVLSPWETKFLMLNV